MNPLALSSADIAWHIPHQGSMCLLDGVLAHDAAHIVCRASSHLQADNPLREAGRLGTALGIEYAAQATALHCALLLPQAPAPRSGYLASVREVQLLAPTLDAITAPLHIRATRLAASAESALYAFIVHAADTCLLQGRIAAVLDASAAPNIASPA